MKQRKDRHHRQFREFVRLPERIRNTDDLRAPCAQVIHIGGRQLDDLRGSRSSAAVKIHSRCIRLERADIDLLFLLGLIRERIVPVIIVFKFTLEKQFSMADQFGKIYIKRILLNLRDLTSLGHAEAQ